jgi:hypothetical protein
MKVTPLFIIAMCLLIAIGLHGCASAPPELASAPPRPGMTAFATLADSGNPADMAAAVVKTGIAGYLHAAARMLRDGEIDLAYAQYCRREAVFMHGLLGRALAARDLQKIGEVAGILETDRINLEIGHAKHP